jgi:polyisoprenoid-binding protein YceI
MRAPRVAAVLAFGLVGCGGVQQATIGPPVVPTVAVAEVAPRSDPALRPRRTRNAIIHSEGSSLEVTSGTIFGTEYSRVTRFRGRVSVDELDPSRAVLVVDLDMTSFWNPSHMITAILQYEFLEIDQHPNARLEATLRAGGGAPEERIVEGTLDLHGVRRAVSFKGRLAKEGGDWRFTSTFDLDRRPFGIRQHDNWDWLNRNDIRVHLDMRATPERVVVEEAD